ncbi:MAG: hypothetical protein KatS3mg077_2869 [Candidatus Binatia bacterium]|nr:MAG: hypothetical protein KatS3mg077_2869 [Candidatus Binatia bacterium]
MPAAQPDPIVFRWDLDKTYLRSEFDSLRDLVKIPFEKPEEKITVPGVVTLIRNLRRVAREQGREVRVFFISASPPQIAKAIKDKLALDGTEYEGITFKNQLQHIMRGRFRNLREQVGYKLTVLLRQRGEFPPHAREVLFGDDWESDPLIYSMYADLLAGRLTTAELPAILQRAGVDPELIEEAQTLAAQIAPADAVERIYINLERRSPPRVFEPFGPRLIPAFDYFQSAACLFQDQHLDIDGVAEVAQSLAAEAGLSARHLANSLADICRRGYLHPQVREALEFELARRRVLPPRRGRGLLPRLQWWVRARTRRTVLVARPLPPNQPAIDYLHLVQHWQQRHAPEGEHRPS